MTHHQRGAEIILVVVFIGIIGLLGAAALGWVSLESIRARRATGQDTALHIAESGIEYYRWHIAHDPEDFQDGTGAAGPYVHDALDALGNKVGEYSLEVEPPSGDDTIITVTSTGTSLSDPGRTRTVRAKLSLESFTKYAVVANDVMRFGAGTETYGHIHSNKGIRFDGIAHDLISSSCTTYDDPDHSGPNENCVHTHQPNPSQVFLGGTAFPVPQVDFNAITTDLVNIRTKAQSNGVYLGPSGNQGWHIVLQTNDTMDIYRVTNVTARCNVSGTQTDTDGIANQTLVYNDLAFPANGLVYVEDKLWINGQVNSARLTIAAGTLPDISSTNRDIIINNDLTYTNYDGTDAIGLVAQRNITIGLYSEDDLRIDAALIAQKGRIGRWYFTSSCSNQYYEQTTITVYGSLATNDRYGFSWVCGSNYCSGYANRNLTYDQNLRLNPPPEYPKTNEVEVLDWEDIE